MLTTFKQIVFISAFSSHFEHQGVAESLICGAMLVYALIPFGCDEASKPLALIALVSSMAAKRSGNASAHAPSAKAVSGLPERGIRSAYEQPKRSAVRRCRFCKRKEDNARALSRACSNFAHFKMAASGDGTLSASAAAWPSPAQRKPRKRFRIDEDLCLLKEVVCADPFRNPAAWEDVLRNVMTAVNRELSICGIKERVDLLIGYFRRQDTVNQRKRVLAYFIKEATATNLLLAIYEDDLSEPPHGAQDTLEAETIEDSDADQHSQGPLRVPERRRYGQSAVPTGAKLLMTWLVRPPLSYVTCGMRHVSKAPKPYVRLPRRLKASATGGGHSSHRPSDEDEVMNASEQQDSPVFCVLEEDCDDPSTTPNADDKCVTPKKARTDNQEDYSDATIIDSAEINCDVEAEDRPFTTDTY
ncbi:hypothetical protein HPB51_004667 [Rhipicephalus microplus]|uniref:Uncharacterized protein n=1 Tax=Rhipicephalus microplus TaxID=6941 RepID=A0A9J6EXU9_RHIMP|nr:hypothetical protein HPB51_004667 [Rhipicephalus microplus]